MTTDSVSPQRHLAAVWFADIVGYTAVAARDEPAALRLIERLQALSREEVTRCGGRVVKALGDAVMAEFTSTEAAVRAALALMDRFGSEAVEVPASRLRIGVHVGDVLRTLPAVEDL
jgi:adenylate cyclase